MANIITAVRILCGLSLLFTAPFSFWCYLLYIIGGASDMLDGLIARRMHKETALGAKLDTIADIIFVLVVLIKILRAVYFPPWLTWWIVVILAIKIINIASGFIRHKRFVSVHTIANKICGGLLFLIPLCIDNFPWQPVMVLIIVTCTVSTFAAVQEGHFIRKGKDIE